MSLEAKMVAAVASAFLAAGDLVRSVTVRRRRVGDFDPALGEPERIVEEWREVEAVVSDYAAREVDGERVKATDRKVTIKARATLPEPRPGDAIEVGAETFHVKHVETARAGASALVHVCQVST